MPPFKIYEWPKKTKKKRGNEMEHWLKQKDEDKSRNGKKERKNVKSQKKKNDIEFLKKTVENCFIIQ